MQENKFESERVIELADGSVLTISYSEPFYAKVRQYFKLADHETPTDEHLKEFFTVFMGAA